MPLIRLDHFLSYTNAKNIDNYLKIYETLGFIPMSQTVRHNPGLRNGFIAFNPEYIEFLWVEDEAVFQEKADDNHKQSRQDRRMYAIGLASEDIEALRSSWVNQGLTVEDIRYDRPRDADPDSDPRWAFLATPANALPGIHTFALSYLSRKPQSTDRFKEISVAPNGIYGIFGITFVTEQPKFRARQWQQILAPDQELVETETFVQLMIGAHTLYWITPAIYGQIYEEPWIPASHAFGELAILHLLSNNLEQTRIFFEKVKRECKEITGLLKKQYLYLPKMANDGFRFEIAEKPADNWLHERTTITGESLRIKN